MITKHNFKEMLKTIGFIEEHDDLYVKYFKKRPLKVDFANQKLIYPENTHHNKDNPNGITIHERQTCNFSQNENFVVFECIARLLEKGYKPEHIEIEPKWRFGHGSKGGRADILIKNHQKEELIIIECKTAGTEHNKAWQQTLEYGGQLFTYIRQAQNTQYGMLYSSDFVDGKIKYRNEIITFIDNKVFLEKSAENIARKTYETANSTEEIFQVWKNTYYQDYQTRGFLEDDIAAYHIAKKKYTIADLVHLDYRDIQKKYHAFATILRKYNVSGRENAFDKLVNLFLCKLVDESKNTLNEADELKFYWKGATVDSAFDLQDRLELLYQEGMQKFLKEEVTYINDEQVDQAFRFFKNDPDATKETIQHYFKQLKFFTNNDFAFIDVHNEKLFYQNFAVLLEVVRLFQDISLRTNVDNQFLGDLFEGFLDQGIKQSEGQFFTPMPIVRFIVSALPLKEVIKAAKNTQPKVIDYACGSGHFLNEYAKQIQSLLKNDNTLKKYYQNIYGIEKEYRLSKVAKVSTFMYGQEEVEILYSDALSQNDKIKDGSFSVLIANPPYSVKGFLETLSDKDKKNYKLINYVDGKSYATNNTIQSFFIERAKQLLKPGGIAGIILPSSILSNTDALHIATRELILEYFTIIAIVAFNTGTFGKTGTNTVTLFLQRRAENPASAEHYKNRVDNWFHQITVDKSDVYQDNQLLNAYCQHLKYNMADYQAFLQGDIAALTSYEIFAEYRKSFDHLPETKKLKKQKAFCAKTLEEQAQELEKRFLNYVKQLEHDKLYYFIMAYITPNPVVIVKAPNKSTEIKKFLGYEWSASKGHEGIKYLASAPKKDNSDFANTEEKLEDTEKRALDNIYNIHHIHTPLYNPDNLFDPEKINSIIRDNFTGQSIDIPTDLKDFISVAQLTDMLDFTNTDFKKVINTTAKENTEILSQWEMVKIYDLCKLLKRGKSTRYGNSDIQVIKSGQARGNKEFNFDERYYARNGFISDERNLQKKDLLINSTGVGTAGRVTLFDLDGDFVVDSHITIFRPVKEKIISEFALYYFAMLGFKNIENMAKGSSGQIELTLDTIGNIKIPLPPMEIQQKIVAKCEAVDKEVDQAKSAIIEARKLIENEINNVFNNTEYTGKKIGDVCLINKSTINPLNTPDKKYIYVDIDSVSKGGGFIQYNQVIQGRDLPSRARRTAQVNNVIISTVRPYLKGFSYINEIEENVIFSTGFAILESKDIKQLLTKIVFYYFMYSSNLMEQIETKMPKSSYPSINASDIKNFAIPLPPLQKQQEIVAFCEQQEAIIKEAQAIIDRAQDRKNTIIQNDL